MSNEADDRDKLLLNSLKEGLPLSSEPFREVAERLGWQEEEVITRLKNLEERGEVRKVGAILNPRKMGYTSTLAAVDIPEERLDEAASIINTYRGVTHNYLRETSPNVWFTMTETDETALETKLTELEEKLNSRIIRLPSTKTYKIGVKLEF
jgi:DNA-binding Lrp family transcriptional regulator